MAKYQIVIHEEVGTKEELVDMLKEIADLIDNGMTLGYHPAWEINKLK